MQAFTRLDGRAVPLSLANIDTDQIIPKQFLKTVEREGLGKGLFYDFRFNEDGSVKTDFVLNRPEYAGAGLLIAGENFGCGSSREHAAWALSDFGFRVVIASRFADIFRGNAGKAGLVAAQVEQSDVELLWKLLEEQPGLELTVDLENRTVSAGTTVVPFNIDDYTRWRLLEGLDDIGLTLRQVDAISEFEKSRPSWKPTTLPARISQG